MSLKTYSAFNYGHRVTEANRWIDFSEGGPQISTLIDVGSYTLLGYSLAVARALNSAGALEYEVLVNRTTNTLIISASGVFELLVSSGIHPTLTAYPMMGFTGTDLVAADTYESDSISGSRYITQTPLYNYTPFKYNRKANEGVVRKPTSASLNEVITYGKVSTMQCEMPLITNIINNGNLLRDTATGVEEIVDFLEYAIDKNPLEFVEQFDNPSEFEPCILTKTAGNSNGLGFLLKERVRDAAPGYFEMKSMEFELIEER